jgi:hypothetical protein
MWYEISYPSRLEGGFLNVESDEDITDRKRTEKQHNRKKRVMSTRHHQKTTQRIKIDVFHFKDPLEDQASSFFFSVEAPFPWGISHPRLGGCGFRQHGLVHQK